MIADGPGRVPQTASGTVVPGYLERLGARTKATGTVLCLGLDPDPEALPAGFTRSLAGLERFAALLLEAAAPYAAAVKPNLAFFEAYGSAGFAALERLRATIPADVPVIADAKRGDIDVTARAYAQAFLGRTPTPWGDVEGLGADALTVNPYMGADTLAPLLDVARPHGRGLFVLVRTSNPGAADVEDLRTDGGDPVWAHVARLVDRLGADGPSATAPLSDVGAVVGATAPEHLERLRAHMPRTPFLLPGIGAQGGRVEDLAPAWAPGAAGGLVTASRSIVAAFRDGGGAPADAARAEAERLRAAAWALA